MKKKLIPRFADGNKFSFSFEEPKEEKSTFSEIDLGNVAKCTEKQCAAWSTTKQASLRGMERQDFQQAANSFGNAWERYSYTMEAGGVEIPLNQWNQYQVGDYVDLSREKSEKGFDKNWHAANDPKNKRAGGNTHIGVVSGFLDDGTPVVEHNRGGTIKREAIDNMETYTPVRVYRPAPDISVLDNPPKTSTVQESLSIPRNIGMSSGPEHFNTTLARASQKGKQDLSDFYKYLQSGVTVNRKGGRLIPRKQAGGGLQQLMTTLSGKFGNTEGGVPGMDLSSILGSKKSLASLGIDGKLAQGLGKASMVSGIVGGFLPGQSATEAENFEGEAVADKLVSTAGGFSPTGGMFGGIGDTVAKAIGDDTVGGSIAGGALDRAGQFADVGAFAGPLGMGIGAGVGALVGGIEGAVTFNEREAKRRQAERDQRIRDQYEEEVKKNKETIQANKQIAAREMQAFAPAYKKGAKLIPKASCGCKMEQDNIDTDVLFDLSQDALDTVLSKIGMKKGTKYDNENVKPKLKESAKKSKKVLRDFLMEEPAVAKEIFIIEMMKKGGTTYTKKKIPKSKVTEVTYKSDTYTTPPKTQFVSLNAFEKKADMIDNKKLKPRKSKKQEGGKLNQGKTPKEFVLSKQGLDHTLDGYKLEGKKLVKDNTSSVKGYLKSVDNTSGMKQIGKNLFTRLYMGGVLTHKKGGKSKVNEAGNYTKPKLRKRLFNQIKNSNTMGTPSGKWSARKAQKLAKDYKAAGGGYKD